VPCGAHAMALTSPHLLETYSPFSTSSPPRTAAGAKQPRSARRPRRAPAVRRGSPDSAQGAGRCAAPPGNRPEVSRPQRARSCGIHPGGLRSLPESGSGDPDTTWGPGACTAEKALAGWRHARRMRLSAEEPGRALGCVNQRRYPGPQPLSPPPRAPPPAWPRPWDAPPPASFNLGPSPQSPIHGRGAFTRRGGKGGEV
jgi:hypothetical protein